MTPILDSSQDKLFLRSLQHLDILRHSTDNFAQSSDETLQSVTNPLLDLLLRPFALLHPEFRDSYNGTLNEILERSPDQLKRAMDHWREFTNTFFKSQNRPVPEWPFMSKSRRSSVFMEVPNLIGLLDL